MKKIVFLSLLVISLIPFSHAFANDTDLYILTQMMAQVPPDALIILDLSGSMNYTPAEDTLYVDGSNHCTSGTYDSSYNGPYYSQSGTGHTYKCGSIPMTGTRPQYGDSSCSDTTGFYRTTGTGHTTDCSKVAIAKRAVFNFLDSDGGSSNGVVDGIINSNDQSYLKIRMGYMRFYNCSSNDTVNSTSYNSGCNTLIYPFNTAYNMIYCKSSTSCTPSSSGSATSVAYESATGGTPLAAALNEALYYFNYTKSSDNDAACRQKFAILITDGADTYACSGNGQDSQTDQYKRRRETVAQARALANAGYYVFAIGFGANMSLVQQNTLNWAAYYGRTSNKDLTQSITNMYTIPYGQIYPSGITSCQASTTTTDSEGHTIAQTYDPGAYGISGYAFIAQNESQLDDAIMNIRNFIITLIAQSTSYVAPVVPISQFQSTSSENRMYLGMFKPTVTTMWEGNIKKYGIASTSTSTLSVGDVIDVNNQLVLTAQNTIKDTARSYWSSSADGGDVEKGGIGTLLLAGNPDSRNIYTYLGTNTALTHSSNAFIKSNALITTTLLGASSTTDKNNVIDFIHGWDAWSWNNGPGTKRNWILGAFIHSRPLVIHYGSYDVIYVGANDGMLHAFKDTNGTTSDDGTELWGFIPPGLLPNLKNFNNSLASLQIFVDGSPKAYVTYVYNADGSIQSVSQAILIFGERRGGNQYFALDVTNPSAPNFLWSISPTQIITGTTTTSTTAYQELGQSWSTPILGKIKNGTGTKWVAFIGGGYDTNQDNSSPSSDTHGRAVYVVDITNGNQIWKYSNSNDSNMKYCIPTDISPLDVNGDGLIERLYVGDVGGEIWRFDIGDMSNTASWKGELIFKGSGKIFYPPDVTFESNRGSGTYDMLFFGTGDREKPNNTTVTNTLYAIKDYDTLATPVTALTESNLIDVTQDVLQSSSATQAQKAALLTSLKTGSGWYIRLNQSAGENPDPGEKCSGTAVVLGGALYYTTFTPTPINTQSVCSLGTGSGNVYSVQYQTGVAFFDLNNDTTISANDRSISVGSGIPSGIIIAIINGTVTGYGGVAGGVFSPQLTITNSIVPLDWRIVF
jgi:Tfp pilus tip-associated adhesin PilY1